MNLPLMRRGLSPEGRKIRERHQGTLTIGIQGITVHPAERGHSNRDFLHDNVKRLREIQARCKERDTSRKSQPLKATRESSASTSSSLRQVNSLLPLRNGSSKNKRRSHSSDREGSAHSDYFSLAEEQIEPLNVVSQSNQCLNQQDEPDMLDNHFTNNNELRNIEIAEDLSGRLSRNSSRLSQSQPVNPQHSPVHSNHRPLSGSPSRLKPLSHKPAQTSVSTMTPALRQDLEDRPTLHSDYNLTQGLRKLRMESLISRIKNQKPACEMDYNSHYKAIENQHRLLLDNADVLSLYGSGDSSVQNGVDTQREVKKANLGNQKMVRSHSFDRDLSKKKNSAGAGKSNRLDSASNKKNMKNIGQPSSPLVKKRLSKSTSKLSCVNTNSSNSVSPEQIKSRTLEEKWRSELESRRDSGRLQENDRQLSSSRMERSKSNLERPMLDTIAYNSQDTELSDDEFNCQNNDSESVRATANADPNLDATLSSSCELNYPDRDQSYESRHEDLQLNIHSESQSELGAIDHCEKESFETSRDGGQNSAFHYSHSDFDITGNQLEETQQSTEPERTSTPVPNTNQIVTPPKLKRREQSDTHRSTLRRSQSLKNIKQQSYNPPTSYQRGKLPRYLLARKEEERRLAEIAKSVDPDCPPGHAPLPECERRNTLHLLSKSQAEVMRDLSSLPVAQDTLRVKKRRHDLEEKLMQIEDGLRIFSQPKVYVVNDE